MSKFEFDTHESRTSTSFKWLMVGALGAILTKNEKEEEEKGGKRQFPQLSITTKQR
jgi:hypothetical protein